MGGNAREKRKRPSGRFFLRRNCVGTAPWCLRASTRFSAPPREPPPHRLASPDLQQPKNHKGTGASADPLVCEARKTTSSSRPSSWSPSSRPSSSWQPWYYLLERRGSSRPIPRWIGGSCGSIVSSASRAARNRGLKNPFRKKRKKVRMSDPDFASDRFRQTREVEIPHLHRRHRNRSTSFCPCYSL